MWSMMHFTSQVCMSQFHPCEQEQWKRSVRMICFVCASEGLTGCILSILQDALVPAYRWLHIPSFVTQQAAPGAANRTWPYSHM